jgi:hypothetical protein
MVERAGSEVKLGFKTHPHMLRHACGYALANKGHDTRALQAYLGHRNIQHTATCILEKRKPVTDQDDRASVPRNRVIVPFLSISTRLAMNPAASAPLRARVISPWRKLHGWRGTSDNPFAALVLRLPLLPT